LWILSARALALFIIPNFCARAVDTHVAFLHGHPVPFDSAGGVYDIASLSKVFVEDIELVRVMLLVFVYGV
jgi:hypothetical protein